MAEAYSRTAKDTYVDEGRPDKNFSGATTFTARNGGGGISQCLGLLRASVPVPAGATVISAVLVLTQGAGVGSGRTVYLRRLTEDPNFGNVDWNHKPTHTTVGQVAAAKAAGEATTNSQWWFDITAYVQDVVNGGQNLGWKVTCDENQGLNFASSEHPNVEFQPLLAVVYSTAPSAPTKLKPSAAYVSTGFPTVSCDYTDRSGSTQLASIRVQVDPTAAFAGGEWDSLEVPVNQPALNLGETDYPGLDVGDTTWWRVMVKDGDNNWSGWSEATWFGNASQGVLTITNPAEGLDDPPPDPGETTFPPEFPSGIPGHGGGHG